MTDLLLALLLVLTPLVPHRVSVTAYSYTGSRTASGIWPQAGRSVACPKSLRLGAILWLEGWGLVRCDDRFGCCTDLDLYLATEEEAQRWGRRNLWYVVVRP